MTAAVFAWSLSTSYADQYLLRQAQALDSTPVLAVASARSLQESGLAEHVGSGSAVTLAADLRVQRALNVGRQHFNRSETVTRGLVRAFESRSVDLVYAMFLWNASGAAEAVRRYRRTRPVRFVIHAAGSDVMKIKSMTKRNRRDALDVLRSADLVLCGSEFIHEYVHDRLGITKTAVHYIGVDPSYLTQIREPVPGEQPETLRLVATSRLHPVKGLNFTLDAFALLIHDLRVKSHLTIAGDGPMKDQLVTQAQRLNLTENVTFLGEVSRSEVRRTFDSSDAFVQHNVALRNGAEEALGGSLLEASARGLPVIASRSGGVQEAVIHEKTGLLVEPGDVEAMAQALLRVAESVPLRRRLGRAGRAFVESTHNGAVQDGVLKRLLTPSST